MAYETVGKGSKVEELTKLAKLVRYYILVSTAEAGSGHPTSALSATDLVTGLMFGGTFRYDANNPDHPNNDRLIFSKGHASPLLYAVWAAAGKLSGREMLTYRQFGSPLEGHPTTVFPFVDAATGSLGQGLSIGVGMAMNARFIDRLPYRTYVLLGDSEMAEGSQWESIQIAAHYKLDNLIGIMDVNRLGQRGETMYGHDIEAYVRRVNSFGWDTVAVDGHNFEDILPAFGKAGQGAGRPLMIIARTVKGKGAPVVEDKNGWHGKALDEEQMKKTLEEMGEVDTSVRGSIRKPEDLSPEKREPSAVKGGISYEKGKKVPTRNAYGNALKRIFPGFPGMVVLDAEVSNSTRAEYFREAHPERFFEMFIAEQNMVGTALGFSTRGKLPFVSSFAAFLTRAHDQIRMCQYSNANIKFCGSHAGVSIGQDGPSQMGLEDIAMFRSILRSVVLYPCDAVSAERLVEEMASYPGMAYMRTTRMGTPVIYESSEEFPIGGSKVLRRSDNDAATVVAAGVTLHEALAAYEDLQGEGISIRVIDLYSVKPVDEVTLDLAARETKVLLAVEDHYAEGGIAEAVRSALISCPAPVHSLSVTKTPKSGEPGELLNFEDISKTAIMQKIKEIISG
ncbi:MAG: transketolase [Candidatus Sulfobium sp.]|jgi:transketolase